jgi:CheY-like chemotaxis protein
MTVEDRRAVLTGRRILVVEDDYLVAQALCAVLEDAGATVVGPIGWLDEALDFVTTQGDRFDAAVLDVNLHGEKSYPIADRLRALNIHFVFTTGYGADALDATYQQYPRCEKPFSEQALLHALNENQRNPY